MSGAFLLQHAGYLIALAALLCGSAFFSGSETALFSLSPAQIQQLRARGRSGRLAAGLLDRPAILLQALLLGNMLVNVAFAAVAATVTLDILQADLPGWLALLVTLGPLLALILLAEVLPKLLAVSHPQRLAALVSWPVATLVQAAGPVLWVLQRGLIAPLTRLLAGGQPTGREITSEELAAVLALSAKRGAIDTDAHSLLQEIMALTDLRARDIMVPRVDMVAFEINAPRAALTDLLARTHLRKVPVYQDHLDNVLGVIHAKTLLLRPQTPLRELVTRAAFVPEAARLERVLLQFRVTRMQMAIVVDEYGGTSGLITLQDVLEEIVGDLPDPFSKHEAAVEPQRDGAYLLDGNLPVHELADALKMDLSDRHISTLGGFVISLIGRIPHEGETVTFRNLQFTIVSMRKRRIGQLRLELVQERTRAPGLDIRLRGGPEKRPKAATMLDNLSTTMQWAMYWAVVVAGVCLSALYSGMEMGFYVLNKVRLELAVEHGRRGARSIHHQLAHPRRLLATLLIGNNVVNYAVTYAISAMFVLGGSGHRSELYAILVGTGVLFVLADTLPKNVFQRLAETLVYRLMWLVRLSGWVFTVTGVRPLVLGFAWLLTRFWRARGDDQALGHVGVAAIVAEGQASGALTDFQTRMAQRVMGISQVTLKKAMIPMSRVVTAPADVTRDGIFEIMRAHEYRRLPLRDASGRIAGVLDIYQALSSPPQTDLQSLAQGPLVLEESLNITQALYRMQRQRIAMAVVADAQTRHVGIVTIKDFVEEIVGELENW